MKKTKRCKHCQSSFGDVYFCDNCSKDLLKDCCGIPITISFSYGHDLDGEEYHFCSNECAAVWFTDEMNKNNPETRFIFGKSSSNTEFEIDIKNSKTNLKKEKK